ncbi:MAG: FmdB family zinc ribbon protein [Planctomycetia bacterium]
MPLYEYDCPDCGSAVELLVRFGEAPACPACDGVRLAKRFSVTAAPAVGRGAARGGCDASLPPCGLPTCGRLRPGGGAG